MTDGSLARRVWTAIEPYHAVAYFAPEPIDAMKALGLKGFWMGYFAGRAAPVGPVGAEPVTAMFFNFAPSRVARALPDAWSVAAPEAVLRARIAAVDAALAPIPVPEEAVALAIAAADAAAARPAGRPLGAAWAGAVDRLGGWSAFAGRPHVALWLATTVVREHRGDGHVAALTSAGLDGCEALVLFAADEGNDVGRETLQPARGWTDDEWDAAVARLHDGGMLDAGGAITEDGRTHRAWVEALTDARATRPLLEGPGADGAERLADLVRPLSRMVVEAGTVPVPNPMGAPRP